MDLELRAIEFKFVNWDVVFYPESKQDNFNYTVHVFFQRVPEKRTFQTSVASIDEAKKCVGILCRRNVISS